MRPIALRSPVPAIPTTSVENSSGAMIILIIRRNASARGRIATPKFGKMAPTTTPATRPMKILVVSFTLSPRLHRRPRFAVGFPALDRLALVVLLLAFREAYGHLYPAVLEVHPDRNQRHPFFDRLADQLSNLVPMQEQLPPAHLLVVRVP